MSDELDLGNLAITITDGEPAEAKFDLPNGTSVTRTFPESGTINMRLGLGLSLSHGRPSGGGGGGGGVPEWVIEDQPVGTDPSTISHHIRLYGGSAMAWERDVGEVAVDTLLGADPNSSSFDTTEYDPGDLTALGLVPGLPVAFIGSARTKYLAGATLLIRSEQFEGGTGDGLWIVAMSADGEDYIHTTAWNQNNGNTTRVYSVGGTLDETFPNTITYETGTINRTGVTFVSDRIDVSSNGDVAFTSEVTTGDRPPGNPFACALFQANTADAITSITFYDPLASAASLPALTEVP